MTWKLVAIVSGGQTGADRAGLQAAIDLDLGWGGWAPKGWHAEDGEIPLVYRERMKQTSSSDYGMRTRLNVQDSDGTLIVSFGEKLTGGSEFTQKTCERMNKSHLHLVLPERGQTRIPEAVRAGVLEWIEKAKISILNVAGPRESKENGLHQAVRDALVWIFEDTIPAVETLSGVKLAAGPPADGEFVRVIEEQAARIATLGEKPDALDANPETVTRHPEALDGIDIRVKSYANYDEPLEGSFTISREDFYRALGEGRVTFGSDDAGPPTKHKEP
jgi:hypothetical protein